MFLHVTEVAYLKKYQLRLTFDNDITKDVDLKDELYGEIFEPLKDVEFFKQVAINPDTNTIEWPNGADFDPETLRNWPEYVDELAARAQQWAKEKVS